LLIKLDSPGTLLTHNLPELQPDSSQIWILCGENLPTARKIQRKNAASETNPCQDKRSNFFGLGNYVEIEKRRKSKKTMMNVGNIFYYLWKKMRVQDFENIMIQVL
jgi:hypothetical protein